jgi:hypothetical protein
LDKILIKDFLEKKSNLLYFIIIVIIAVLIIYWRILIQVETGPLWDTIDFLSNAMYFAGQGFGYADFTRPPFFSFIVSLFFRLGFISQLTIYIVDCIFFIFGVIGLYQFLKLRFRPYYSFFGSLLFISFPIMLSYVSVGYSDITAVSLSIWALYFTVLAIKKNSKFFWVSFPFFMLAFLTRYPAALIAFPMIFYLIINLKKVNYKNLFIGILLSVLIFIPVMLFFFDKFGNPFYPFLVIFGFTQNSLLSGTVLTISSQYNANLPVYVMGEVVNLPENTFYNTDLFYFIKRLPFIGPTSLMILFISIVTIMIHVVAKLKEKSLSTFTSVKKDNNNYKILLVIILILLFLLTLGKINYLGSELIFFILGFVSYDCLKEYKVKHLDIDFIFLFYFMSFFIFNSVYNIKDDRYFLAMAPAFVYFLIRGFNFVVTRFKFEYKNLNLTSIVLSFTLIIMLFSSTTAYLFYMPEDRLSIEVDNKDIFLASSWLMGHDPNYENKIIYSDYWPFFSWYLKTNVKAMPAFKNNKIYYYRLKDYRVDFTTNMLYNKELDDNNVDYYISNINGLNLTSLKPIKQFGRIIIYKRI